MMKNQLKILALLLGTLFIIQALYFTVVAFLGGEEIFVIFSSFALGAYLIYYGKGIWQGKK